MKSSAALLAVAVFFLMTEGVPATQKNGPAEALSSPTQAQQGNGPTLEATMKFVQDKVAEQPKLEYKYFDRDTGTGAVTTYPAIVDNKISWNKCEGKEISGRLDTSTKPVNGIAKADQIATIFNLKNVKKVVVYRLDSSPQVYNLQMKISADQSFSLGFTDEDDANRVAKALTHAIELCGGGNEPF